MSTWLILPVVLPKAGPKNTTHYANTSVPAVLFTVFGNINDPQLHVYLVDPAGCSPQSPLLSIAVPKTTYYLNTSVPAVMFTFLVISRIHSCMSTWLILPVVLPKAHCGLKKHTTHYMNTMFPAVFFHGVFG